MEDDDDNSTNQPSSTRTWPGAQPPDVDATRTWPGTQAVPMVTTQPSPISPSFTPVPLDTLTEHDVVSLLGSLGLEKYADQCLAVPLRGADLVHCTESDLEAAGVTFRPHRLSLLSMIDGFRTDGVPAHLLRAAARSGSVMDEDDNGSGDMPAWLSQAQASLSQLDLSAGEADDETYAQPSPAPAAVTVAQSNGKEPANAAQQPQASETQRMTEVSEADDLLGPLPLGARALHAARQSAGSEQHPSRAPPNDDTGTIVLPRGSPSSGSASSSSLVPDESSATLEIHFAEDRCVSLSMGCPTRAHGDANPRDPLHRPHC